MAIFNYKKYQILLRADANKPQKLQTGDIVRRQYFDGKKVIYSLMCVLSHGVEDAVNPSTGKMEHKPYFVGALLDGDAPKQSELLDFARVTNMFNLDRSGALYLTSSDSESPYMDVIDNIGQRKSISWPTSASVPGFEDASSQYVIAGAKNFSSVYTSEDHDLHRIISITRTESKTEAYEGLKQDFYQFVQNPNKVVISYKVKANQSFNANMSVGYADGLKKDAEWSEAITTEWQYKFHVVTVDYSGRHLRSFKVSLDQLNIGDSIQIADMNIILLSSLANFGDSTTARVGKLEGVSDPVFGKLDGYGAYLQKLYASRSAHISGTLTAGDENGFGATFYAGKIHRNCFINSLDVKFTPAVLTDDSEFNPTGTGKVYKSSGAITMMAQTNEWLINHAGERYCFSFWINAKKPCTLSVIQNSEIVGTINVEPDQTHAWYRMSACFDLLKPKKSGEHLLLGIHPAFSNDLGDVIENEENQNADLFFFSAPQLESGESVTQYQPTDSQLNYTEGYGAWFSRGGIGGTIQNPLLKFNPDGSFASRNDSFVINPDGSGQFSGGKLRWDRDSVSISGLKVKWEDFDDETQDILSPKSIRILGESVFVIDDDICTPESIDLNVHETNFTAAPESVAWFYYDLDGTYQSFGMDGNKKITVRPGDEHWKGRDTLTIKCAVDFNQNLYVDTITIRKSRQGEDAYSIQILSSNGNTFKNGIGSTDLVAHVYKGGTEITDKLHKKDFDWIKTSSNADTDRIFNLAHAGWGNVLTITSEDIWNMAQFDCRVRIN